MNVGPHVLVVSRDEMLLQTRQLILGTFFQVNGAGRMQEVQALMASKKFDLIVLCYSLSNTDCQRVCDLAACQTNRPQILMLRAAGSDLARPGADEELGAEAGPYGLLKKAAEMLAFDLKAKLPSAAAIRAWRMEHPRSTS
jgi:CheY-like chemotaxis protein